MHRDLKSANVFLARSSGDDLVKLLDFGISKIFPTEQTAESEDSGVGDSPTWITDTGIVVGTPHYMAPEQAEESRSVDHRADLYSLGVILYEMITGGLPFAGTNIWNVLIKHANEEPEPPCKRRPDLDIPRDLERVVMRAMGKDPDGRYATAAEMLAALEDAVASGDRAAPVPLPAGRGLDLRWVVPGILILGLAGFFAVKSLSRPEHDPREPDLKLQLLPDSPTDFSLTVVKEAPGPTKTDGSSPDHSTPDASVSPGRPGHEKKTPLAKGHRPPRPPPTKKTGTPRIPQKSDIPPNPYDEKK